MYFNKTAQIQSLILVVLVVVAEVSNTNTQNTIQNGRTAENVVWATQKYNFLLLFKKKNYQAKPTLKKKNNK